MPNYHQGKYTLKHPEKYAGDPYNVVYRSSWEAKLMRFLDSNPDILAWGSEEVIIPYISPLDKEQHRYFVDFVVKLKTKTGEIKKVIIEVKPKSQTIPPVKPTKITKRYIQEAQTYIVNQAKWSAAKEWCKKKGFEFMIATEDTLGIK